MELESTETQPAPFSSRRGITWIVGLRCGRLANRLVLFANLAALAEEQGDRVVNVTFQSYAHLFESTRRDIYCRYPAPRRRSLFDVVPGVAPALRKTRLLYHLVRSASVLNERFPVAGKRAVTVRERREVLLLDGPEIQDRVRAARRVFLYGWNFRAPRCVRRQADKIRAFFQPIPELCELSRSVVDGLRARADVVIGVHIRHGDYRTWKKGAYFFTAARYADWMRDLQGQFPGRRVAFLVCSDEPRNPEEFSGLTVAFGTPSPVADLYALARCDYLIGPPSTFSQWASFHGNIPLCHVRHPEDRLILDRFSVSWLDEVP